MYSQRRSSNRTRRCHAIKSATPFCRSASICQPIPITDTTSRHGIIKRTCSPRFSFCNRTGKISLPPPETHLTTHLVTFIDNCGFLHKNGSRAHTSDPTGYVHFRLFSSDMNSFRTSDTYMNPTLNKYGLIINTIHNILICMQCGCCVSHLKVRAQFLTHHKGIKLPIDLDTTLTAMFNAELPESRLPPSFPHNQ